MFSTNSPTRISKQKSVCERYAHSGIKFISILTIIIQNLFWMKQTKNGEHDANYKVDVEKISACKHNTFSEITNMKKKPIAHAMDHWSELKLNYYIKLLRELMIHKSWLKMWKWHNMDSGYRVTRAHTRLHFLNHIEKSFMVYLYYTNISYREHDRSCTKQTKCKQAAMI